MNKTQTCLENSYTLYGEFEYLALHNAYAQRGLSVSKFDIVSPSKWGIENGLFKPDDVLKVAGFSRDGKSVRIIRNNNKHSSSYWPGFIQPKL